MMGMYSDMENIRIDDVDVLTEEETKQRNRELCEKYPFLIPSNRFSGKRITECCGPDGEEGYWPGDPKEHPDYDFSYTELDDLPEGWRIAFGEDICKEIMDELVEHDLVDKYRITQIKEKFGDLRWYDNGSPNGVVNEIVDKYESLSARTCICCGRPARFITRGWISPYCENCLTEEGQKKADWLDENGNYIRNPNDKKEDEVQNKVGDEPKEESTE